jgi:hypothetical protein
LLQAREALDNAITDLTGHLTMNLTLHRNARTTPAISCSA